MLGFFSSLLWIPFVVVTLLIAAQIVLSSKQRKWWLGLLLPGALLLGTIVLLIVQTTRDTSLPYHTFWENVLTGAARFFLYNIMTGILCAIYGIRRVTRKGIKVLLVVLIFAIIPFPVTANDGGTTLYNAVLYRITFLHRIDQTQPTGYRTGTTVDPFPINFIRQP